MTRYLDKSFSVHVGGDAYRDGWEAVFGQRYPDETTCGSCGGRKLKRSQCLTCGSRHEIRDDCECGCLSPQEPRR